MVHKVFIIIKYWICYLELGLGSDADEVPGCGCLSVSFSGNFFLEGIGEHKSGRLSGLDAPEGLDIPSTDENKFC